MQKHDVIFDHDGGVDDLLSLMLLLTMDHINLLGVTITPADCYLPDATESTLKILALFGRQDVPVSKGTLHGINAFPADWRAQPKICNALPLMLRQVADEGLVTDAPAHKFIGEMLTQNEDVIVLMTGPCTNLVQACLEDPSITKSIRELVWMGGAVDVPGNVATHNHNTTAEWNAFWDPVATRELFGLGINIKLIALDATNCLPVNRAFLERLATQNSRLSDLAGQFWAATVNSIPAYEFTYFMWDVLATCDLGLEDGVITYDKVEIDVSVTEPNAGETFRQPGNGQWVNLATEVKKDIVLDYVLHQFSREPENLA